MDLTARQTAAIAYAERVRNGQTVIGILTELMEGNLDNKAALARQYNVSPTFLYKIQNTYSTDITAYQESA